MLNPKTLHIIVYKTTVILPVYLSILQSLFGRYQDDPFLGKSNHNYLRRFSVGSRHKVQSSMSRVYYPHGHVTVNNKVQNVTENIKT